MRLYTGAENRLVHLYAKAGMSATNEELAALFLVITLVMDLFVPVGMSGGCAHPRQSRSSGERAASEGPSAVALILKPLGRRQCSR